MLRRINTQKIDCTVLAGGGGGGEKRREVQRTAMSLPHPLKGIKEPITKKHYSVIR